ncbi:MAG: beta-galactosidase, partial [Armatimonadota bacterium]|nr:beta-galactosidase [Armatimonadota bacterium]
MSTHGLRAPAHNRPTRLPRFLFGAAYYPEHWSEVERKEDPPRMAAAGFNVVRMGEFAWEMMEPADSHYDFSFFEKEISRLAMHGIHTILCTPTAAPPRWLTAANPQVLRVDRNGRTMAHGSRQHACHSSPLFRDYSRRITEAMAAHFAENPHVIGWQIDNEFHCHFSECYCQACLAGFQQWLEQRYHTIEDLNRAWGTVFWSQTYNLFDHVVLPTGEPAYENPSHLLDYYRYLSAAVTRFQKEQVDILRRYNPDWFIFHNGVFAHIDYREFARDLDFLGYDVYPGFWVRQQGPAATAARLDRVRSYAGNFLVPEQQSGPGGQKPYLHETPAPGEMRLWTWQSIAHGADGVLHFRWRTCRFGAEEYWCGILDHDNQPRRRYHEAAREGAELARIGREILGTHVRIDVGILCDVSQQEAHATLPMGLPGPNEAGEGVHRALWRRKFAAG